MNQAPINKFKPHPAQMRTSHDLEALATLTLQVYERGLDNWQPIVATANGQTTAEGSASYYIISGHRRHLAQLLAFALQEAKEKQADEGIKICIEDMQRLKEVEGVKGFHIMAIEWEEKVPEIVEGAGLYPRPKVD